ncbi:MAG: metallophosphoesterase family protein [Desulfobacteraceae bacterium]|nr:metallophosphoesterase family protein [Desulfobacteraceae bacterium]MCB9494855.1 metallophosphoesterase family protein [Desulfobacteraceae bacterium]
MRIVSFSDIHGNFKIFEKSKNILLGADIVILSGDITHFGGDRESLRGIKELKKYFDKDIFAVTGNCDLKSAEKTLNDFNINLSEKVIEKKGFLFTGLKGSLVTPFSTPNEFLESDYEKMLSGIEKQLKKEVPLVLVSHQPPFDCKCDVIDSGIKTGSIAIRRFIENYSPVVCFTGHIHEAYGTGKIGNTIIVNPGQAEKGRAAIMDYNNGSCEIYVKTF